MPKHTDRPSARVRTSADPVAALIDSARVGTTKALPPPEALDALRRICAYNDSETSPTKKVSMSSAVELLQTNYAWTGTSRSSLDSLCRRALGRKSWGSK